MAIVTIENPNYRRMLRPQCFADWVALLSLLPRLHPCPRRGRITLNGVSQNVIPLAIKSEGIRYLYKDTL